MEVTVPCPICKTINACDCRKAIAAYLRILDAVSTRVLREQASSKVEHLPVKSAGVDKLELLLTEALPTELILERSRRLGLTVAQTYLKERTPFLKISDGDHYILLKPGIDRKHIVKMISNPNRFNGWGPYMDFIENVLGPYTVESGILNRLDLNLDFSCTFADLIQSIDVKNKRSALSFKDESGERTGVIIGKGNENIEIYDKTKQAKLDTPCARIEIRLGGKKLPTRQITHLPLLLQSRDLFAPLEGVNLHFTNNALVESKADRLIEFQSLLKREGFYAAKKSMNKERNFDRNFSGLIQIKYWDTQPSQLFKDRIKDFFEVQNETYQRPKLEIFH